MYISGSPIDFESRLHSMPVSIFDINSFLSEGQGYLGSSIGSYTSVAYTGAGFTGNIPYDIPVRWDREMVKQVYLTEGDATTGGYFI